MAPDIDYDELEEMSEEELEEKYNETVNAGANRGARGMGIGPAVMEGSAIKAELRSREEDGEDDD